MISSYGEIFIGVNVNPKTKEPVFVVREEHHDRTVIILGLVASDINEYVYAPIGTGYLNSSDDTQYSAPTQVTGYPRSHTPGGLKPEYRGRGYGTCLYTGLVQLATAGYEKFVKLNRLDGKGAGICSAVDDRSDEAEEWWQSAVRRGMAHKDYGTATVDGDDRDSETETNEDEDLFDYMSSRSARDVRTAIHEAVDGHSEWSVASIYLRGDLERTVEKEEKEIEANYYTYKDALKYRLIAVQAPWDGSFEDWTKLVTDSHIKDTADGSHKDVILALNVAHQDVEVVGKLALIARAAGATDREVTELMIRNRYQMDIISKELPEPPAWHARFGPRIRRMRIPPQTETGAKENPARWTRAIGTKRRNPGLEPSGQDRRELARALENLEARREALGWNLISDLP